MQADTRKDPKSHVAWGLYNYGRLISVARTRHGAMMAAQSHTGKLWQEAKKYMEIHKVRVETYRP